MALTAEMAGIGLYALSGETHSHGDGDAGGSSWVAPRCEGGGSDAGSPSRGGGGGFLGALGSLVPASVRRPVPGRPALADGGDGNERLALLSASQGGDIGLSTSFEGASFPLSSGVREDLA